LGEACGGGYPRRNSGELSRLRKEHSSHCHTNETMLVYVVIAIGFVVVFHIFVFHQYNWPWIAKIINKIPGPSGVPYFGSTFHFWNMKNEGKISFWTRWIKKYAANDLVDMQAGIKSCIACLTAFPRK